MPGYVRTGSFEVQRLLESSWAVTSAYERKHWKNRVATCCFVEHEAASMSVCWSVSSPGQAISCLQLFQLPSIWNAAPQFQHTDRLLFASKKSFTYNSTPIQPANVETIDTLDTQTASSVLFAKKKALLGALRFDVLRFDSISVFGGSCLGIWRARWWPGQLKSMSSAKWLQSHKGIVQKNHEKILCNNKKG